MPSNNICDVTKNLMHILQINRLPQQITWPHLWFDLHLNPGYQGIFQSIKPEVLFISLPGHRNFLNGKKAVEISFAFQDELHFSLFDAEMNAII